MAETNVLTRVARKGANPEKIADFVIDRPDLISQLLEGLDSEEKRIRYGCAKVLRRISEKEPATLYPHIDFFIALLDDENSFLRWDAIRVVANLTTVDSRGRIEQILDKYLEPIRGPVMITGNNTLEGAATIALARPELADKIARAILKVEYAEYQTAECRNVAIGGAIQSLNRIFEVVENQEEILTFVKKQLENTRNATRKKATEFLKKREG